MNPRLNTLVALFLVISAVTTARNLHAQGIITAPNGQTATTSNTVQTITSGSTNTTITYFQFGTNALSATDNYIYINSGAYLLNPYQIVNSNQLSSSKAQAVFYLQLGFDYVAAWNLERRERLVNDYFNAANTSTISNWEAYLLVFDPGHCLIPWNSLDFSGNITYFAQGNSQPTASTIVGAGDFSADVTLGIPLYMALFTDAHTLSRDTDLGGESLTNLYNHTSSVQWAGLIESYGVTTDRADFSAHNRVFTGLGYRGAFRSPYQNLRDVLVNVQIGCAWIDATRFANSTDNTIQMQNGAPKYFFEPGFAIESDILVPISDAANIDFGASVYSNHEPDLWNAHIGLTFPLEKITSLL